MRELTYTFRPRLHGASKLDTQVALDFIGLLIAKMTGDAIPVRFLSFVLVGAFGVVVHLAALSAAIDGLGVAFAPAQATATLISMTSNFFFNNLLTYHDQRLSGFAAFRGLVLFYAICTVGAISNIGVANWLYVNKPVWWLAGLAGSVVGRGVEFRAFQRLCLAAEPVSASAPLGRFATRAAGGDGCDQIGQARYLGDFKPAIGAVSLRAASGTTARAKPSFALP